MAIKKCISITEEEALWLESNGISPSKLIKNAIKEKQNGNNK